MRKILQTSNWLISRSGEPLGHFGAVFIDAASSDIKADEMVIDRWQQHPHVCGLDQLISHQLMS